MKIICNKDEFTHLVRECALAAQDDCYGCNFFTLCSKGNTPKDTHIMSGIEDICEVISNG